MRVTLQHYASCPDCRKVQPVDYIHEEECFICRECNADVSDCFDDMTAIDR